MHQVPDDVKDRSIRVHVLRTSLCLPVDVEQVFRFFSNASNLERITPPELHFHIITEEPIDIREGTLIGYRLRIWGIPFRWRTRIANWDPPNQFIDEQVKGPYKQWIHVHRFTDRNGTTTIRDEVFYQLPFWPLGEIAYPLVSSQLRRIFSYRNRSISDTFSESG
jgi:ligand-binding SRPBCC domain-containing protein